MDLHGLSSICAGLGTIEEDQNGVRIGYVKNDYCLDNLKDLQRFLRRDDPKQRDVFKQVCKWNTVKKDLVPIIEHFQDDRNLVISAVKILVFLTMPIEPTSTSVSQQIEYLWELKASLTRNDTLAVIVSLLESPLENLEREAFSEDDWKLVQLVLTLFRNLLAIQDITMEQKSSGCATQYLSLRDRFLELLFSENVMDLILVLTQHVGGSCGYLRQDNLLLLEIFDYIFTGQDPELVVRASQKHTKADEDVKASVNSLKSMMEEEEAKRRRARLRNFDRHSQFSGTFTRLTMDGSKSLVKGNPGATSRDRLLKPSVVVHRGPIKRIVGDLGRLASSKDKVLERLHDFTNQFLSGGYNELMQSVREDIEKEHPAVQKNDVVVFFHVAQFVTAFQRQKFLLSKKPTMEADEAEVFVNKYADNTLFQGDICGPIAATMNEAMFLLVISKWRNAFDGLKETNDYKSLSAAGSIMKHMIRMLDLVLKLLPDNSKEPQTARILLYKIFYDQTDLGLTHFLLNLFKSFNTHKQRRSDLADLVEMIHVVVRLMENLQARGTLRVSKKSKKGRKKKVLDNINGITDEGFEGHQVDAQDNDCNLSCKHPGDSNPVSKELFEKEGHQVDAQDNDCNLSCKHPGDSSPVSKELFEKDVLDNIDGTAEEIPGDHSANPQGDDGNLSCKQLRDLRMESQEVLENTGSDGKEESISVPNDIDELGVNLTDTAGVGDEPAQAENENCNYKPDGIACGTGDSSEDDLPACTNEVDFKVSSFVSTFANNTIIQNLCWLLKDYKSNSISTNHYIICMLRRICDDLELSPMLYQLSLLTIFYDILAEQKSSNCKEYANIVFFLSNLVRKMMRKMKSQPLLFVEVLFWKTRKECHYINTDSIMNELGKLKKETGNWESGDDVEMVPSEDIGRKHRSIADSLGDDEADVTASKPTYAASSQTDNEKDPYRAKRRKVARRESTDEMNTDVGNITSDDAHNDRRPAEHASSLELKRKKRLVFDDELETKIKNLYAKYKDQKRWSHIIASSLLDTGKTVTAAQVYRKIKQLGLSGPQRLRPNDSKKHSRDMDINESEKESEEETLLSLKKRRKNKGSSNIVFEEATSVHSNEKIKNTIGGDDSDDEVLSSLLMKSGKKPFSRAHVEKVTTSSVEETLTGNDSAVGVFEDAIERDRYIHSNETGSLHDDANINHVDLDDNALLNQIPGIKGRRQVGVESRNNVDNREHQEMYNKLADELEDSGDDAEPVAPKCSIVRRKLKMVIDLEDDDE